MVVPSCDSFCSPSRRDYSSSQQQPPSDREPSQSHLSQPQRPAQFRVSSFDPDALSPATAGGKPIPTRYSSLHASTPAHHQKPLPVIQNKRESSNLKSRTISIPLTGSTANFERPALPWGAQPRTSHFSKSSVGADLYLDEPSSPRAPNDSPPTHPSSPSSTAANATEIVEDFCELTPGDSSSNWSLSDLRRSPPVPPPVPSIPAQFRSFRTMPNQSIYQVEHESGYDSPDPSRAHLFPAQALPKGSTRSRRAAALPPTPDGFDEEDEDGDHIGSLPAEAFGFGNNRSMSNIAGKVKADKMLGLDTNAKLCSLFMISGVGPTDAAKWVPADNVLAARMQPQPDSLGFYWRPELLGTAFSGVATEAFEKAMTKGKKMKKDVWPLVMKPPTPGERGPYVPDAGPEGAEKLISQTIKYAHPRDVEVINTSLMPNTTSHYFSFSIPSHSSTASAARARLNSIQAAENTSVTSFDQTSTINAKQRQDLQKQAKITYYGATLTVWTCAEPDRARQLADIRAQLRKKHELDAVLRAPITEPLEGAKGGRHMPSWAPYRNASTTDFDNSDTETVRSGYTETKRRAPWQARGADPLSLRERSGATKGRGVKGTVESSDVGIGPLRAGEGDTFWMPYSLTLVSRHPIFDTMIDYIRTSWSMYQKSAKRNLYQMCKVLNHPIPRPGEMYRLNIGRRSDGEEMTVETTFPGAVDFDKGLIKTDFQLWPLFQAVDINAILTAIEIAMSRSGKVIFTSQYTAMLCLAVHTLRYMVELRGWSGMAVPVIHARDIALAHDDPGPYILGLPMECRYMLATPTDACVIDLDNNTLTLKSPPAGIVTPRIRREKVKQKIYQALGQQYPMERSIPTELKIAFPNNRFRPFHRVFYDGEDRPHFLGERLRSPPWWKASEVMGVFDKIMVDKHKKPSFIKRIKKSGLIPGDGPITVGEQDMKDTMRLRAVHYIETRDDLEVKVAKINGKLMQLMQEGQKYKRQFLSFERQTDLLAMEQLRLEAAYKREHEEAERLMDLAREQSKENAKLDVQLKATEGARSTAMRQLSDMQESMQDLEREREAIMDIIESQISDAIDNHAAEVAKLNAVSSAVPDSPTSVLSSLAPESQHLATPLSSRSPLPPVSRGYRPGTTESAMSATSKFTSRTDAISILGLARRGYATAAGVDRRQSVDTTSGARDDVAIRIAAIQAKLDLALSVVARNRTDSFATLKQGSGGENSLACSKEDQEGNAGEGGGLGLVVEATEEPASTDGETTPTLLDEHAIPFIDSAGTIPSSPLTPVDERINDSSSIRSSSPASTYTAVPLPISRAGSHSGSRIRIRRKDSSSDGAPSQTTYSPLPRSVQQRTLHAQSLTSSSSTGSDMDMLITPSNSGFVGITAERSNDEVSVRDSGDGRRSSGGSDNSNGSMFKGGDNAFHGGIEEAELGDGDAGKRMSSISTTTVTFGPI